MKNVGVTLTPRMVASAMSPFTVLMSDLYCASKSVTPPTSAAACRTEAGVSNAEFVYSQSSIASPRPLACAALDAAAASQAAMWMSRVRPVLHSVSSGKSF